MARSPNPVPQYFDAENKILSGGLMYYFEDGTDTPIKTYSDVFETIENTHPVVLDAEGRLPNVFFTGIVSQVLEDSNLVQIWRRDSVGGNVTPNFNDSDLQFLSTTDNLINTFNTAPVGGDIIETLGFDFVGDGGGDQWQFTGLTGQTPSLSPAQLTIGLLNDVNGNQWSVLQAEDINIVSYGVTSSGSHSAAYQAAINDALDDNKKTLTSDVVATSAQATLLTNRSNVVLRGTGELFGSNNNTGNYRRYIADELTPSPSSFKDKRMNLVLNNMSDINVVIVGDSLSTYRADLQTPLEGQTELISKQIKEDNPHINFTITGRGVGSQTFDDLDGVATTSFPIADRYPWYTDDMRDWLEYVFDLNPDVVVVAMGTNDGINLDRTSVESVYAKIIAQGAQVIFATNAGVNLSPPVGDEDFGFYINQEGADYVAGWVRTYAQYNKLGLIDINRTFNLVRDGRDILNTSFIEQPSIDFMGVPSEYVANDNQRCRDFDLVANIATEAWTNVNPFAVDFSDGDSNTVFIDDNAGFLRFKFYKGDASGLYLTVTSTIVTPIANQVCQFSLKGNVFGFRLVPLTSGGDAGVQPFTQDVIRYGGIFNPKFYYFSGGGTGPLLGATLSMGVEKEYLQSITDIEMFGSADNTLTGGNWLNHNTSKGASYLYGQHLAVQNYRFDRGVEYDTNSNGAYYKYEDGSLRCEATISAAGGASVASGALFIGATLYDWTFPHAYFANPIVIGSAANINFDASINAGGGNPLISNGYRLQSPLASAATVDVHLVAHGRWK